MYILSLMDRKSQQLGMSFGTAGGRLRKALLFKLMQIASMDLCFRCGSKIELERDMSIEHKEAWLDSQNPIEKFFDLDNVAFSHLRCNSSHKKHWNKKYSTQEESYRAQRAQTKRWNQENYSTEARRARYLRTGN